MARLFISHSSKENFEALAFREWLTQEGWAPTDIFLDLHGIGAGERWKEALAKANERCEAVVLLASPTSLASTECRVELRMAEDYGKEIVVAILHLLKMEDPQLGPYRERQIVDLSIEPREAAFTVSHEGQQKTIAFHRPTLARIKARLDQLGISPTSFPWRPADLAIASPYPGLKGFEAGDAALFFGRAGDIARGLAEIRKLRRMATGQILVIQAASGAGKSSFLKAGLWPRLARDPEFVPLASLRPATGILTGEQGNRSAIRRFLRRARSRRLSRSHGVEDPPGAAETGRGRPRLPRTPHQRRDGDRPCRPALRKPGRAAAHASHRGGSGRRAVRRRGYGGKHPFPAAVCRTPRPQSRGRA